MTDEKKLHVSLEIGDCSGCGACTELAPQHFEWNDDMDKPVQILEEMPEELAREVVSCCPQDCLIFEDQD